MSMTKEQALAVIEKSKRERAARKLYNAKRWSTKKALLAEATRLLAPATK